MRIGMFAAVTVLTLVPAFAADGARLDIKPGLWETAVTVKSNGKVQSFTNKSCVTSEAPDRAFINHDKNCTRTVIFSTTRKEEVNMQCTVGDVVTNGTIEIDVIDSEHIKASSHVIASGGLSMSVNSDFDGHFLNANCGHTRAGTY